MKPKWKQLREGYLRRLCTEVLSIVNGVPNNADRTSRASLALARSIWQQVCPRLQITPSSKAKKPQTVGKLFEQVTLTFLQEAFTKLDHLRPGPWTFEVSGDLHRFAQYVHLAELKAALQAHPSLHAALGDYLIHPDILIARYPLDDEAINRREPLFEPDQRDIAYLTPLRKANNDRPLLHASISCKWTMRSDRAQNVRTEALNLIRNRKGHTPHIVVVTAEPHPGRLASLALGTGDLDCVYHVALPELERALKAYGETGLLDMFYTMVEGRRLRDVADLPLDLAV